MISTPGLHGYSIEFSPFNSNRLACVACQEFGISGGASLLIADFSNNPHHPPNAKVIQNFNWSDGLFDLCWSECNGNFLATAGGDGTVHLWDLHFPSKPQHVSQHHAKEVYSVDWCHTGGKNLIVTGSWDRTCKVLDSNTSMSVINTFEGHHGVVYCTVWSPHFDGCFASSSGDGTVRVWDMRKPYMPQNVLAAHETEVLSCDWSKYDPNILITGSVDCTLKVWDLRNPRTSLCCMSGHRYAVRRVKSSPYHDGVVASCSYDFTTRIWNYKRAAVSGGIPLLETFHHHTEFVYGLSFSQLVPNLMADCSWDETVKLYKPRSLLEAGSNA